jgi:hypothetical protein
MAPTPSGPSPPQLGRGWRREDAAAREAGGGGGKGGKGGGGKGGGRRRLHPWRSGEEAVTCGDEEEEDIRMTRGTY